MPSSHNTFPCFPYLPNSLPLPLSLLFISFLLTAYAKLHGCYKALIGGFSHYGASPLTPVLLCSIRDKDNTCLDPRAGWLAVCFLCFVVCVCLSTPHTVSSSSSNHSPHPFTSSNHPPYPFTSSSYPDNSAGGFNRFLTPYDCSEARLPRLLRHTRQGSRGIKLGTYDLYGPLSKLCARGSMQKVSGFLSSAITLHAKMQHKPHHTTPH